MLIGDGGVRQEIVFRVYAFEVAIHKGYRPVGIVMAYLIDKALLVGTEDAR